MQRQPGAIAQLQNMANKCQDWVPAPLAHGAEAISPLVFVSWVNAPILGPIVQRTETLRSCMCSFMSTQSWLTSVSRLQRVSHFCWTGWGEQGDDPEDTLKTCLERLVHPAKDLICN